MNETGPKLPQRMTVELHEHGVLLIGFIHMSSETFMGLMKLLEGLCEAKPKDAILDSKIAAHYGANMALARDANASSAWRQRIERSKCTPAAENEEVKG